MERLTRLLFLALLLPFSLQIRALAQDVASLDEKLATATDIRVPAGAISLQVQRKLEANRAQRGSLGTRWRLNWESRLSRNGRAIQIEDWSDIVSFTQVDQQLLYKSASGERITLVEGGKAVRTKPDGRSETFDADGRLIERAYNNGNKAVIRYTPRGRLARVEGPGGSFLQFTEDSDGRVVQVQTSIGATVRYAYDKDDLIEVQVNSGLPLRYGYDSKGFLVRIDDPQTGALEIAYDSKGRVLRYRRADGSERRIEYDEAANIKRVIEPNGATTVTQENREKRRTEVTDPLGNKSAIQFDEAGNPVTVTGPTGASSRMSYDSLGRIIAAEDPLGHTTRYEYVGDSAPVRAIIQADGTRQEFEYDDRNNLTAIKVGGKIVGTLTYSPDGSIAATKGPGAKEQKFTYHPNGLVKSVANALGETTQFEYDARGNLARETNPLGGVTVRSYDARDRLVSLTNPAGETTRYEYDYRGRLIRETDSAGGVTKFDYDARGRLAAETNPAGQVTRYEYSPADKLIRTIWPDGTAENYRYDLAGNLVERTDRLGRIFKFERDSLGRVTRERSPSGLEVRYRYDAAGNLSGVEDSSGAKSEYQTDVVKRKTISIDPSGGKTEYQYDPLGNLLAVTDPLGRVKQFGHNADGDLAQVGEPSRDEARYEYDAAGRIVAIRRPSGGVTRFTYDRMGNLLSETDPLGNVKRYSYDNAGRLLSFTDAANRITRYLYDKAGQRTETQLPDGKRVAYKYNAFGRMIDADDGAFPVRISYDDRGNLKQVEYSAIKKAVAYEYDAQGLRTKMIAPDGRETRYEYDALKRLSALVLHDGKRFAFAYDEENRVKSAAYPNGITGHWEYDASGQTAKISYQDKAGIVITGSSYLYDPAGNPIERQDGQGRTSRFTYDPAGQLIEETNPEGTIKYAYAAGGNRTTVSEGTRVSQHKHDAADRLIDAGAEQLSYDANGNLINRKGPGGTTAYEYDTENRLVKVVGVDGATTTFGYAPTGERVWRRDKSGITYFLYDGIRLIAELGDDLRTKTTYIHGLGIDRPLAMLQEKRTYYYHADRVGSITHLTDDNGKVAAAYGYDAFGKVKTKRGAVANPFTYTGRELDPAGLYYFRARYYDAGLGRFVSKDLASARLDEPLEQNPYLFVRNSPVRFIDPLGLGFYGPEDIAHLSTEELLNLYSNSNADPELQGVIYPVLRALGGGTRAGDVYHYSVGPRQPDGSIKIAWKPGSPPDVEGALLPGSQPQQQVVGRPGDAGPRNPNPGVTGEVNGGSPGRAGANTDSVRPQPGAAANNTQGGDAAARGDTLRGSAPEQGIGQRVLSGRGILNVDPNGFWKVGSGLSRGGTLASLTSLAVDCYRNPANCSASNLAAGLAFAGAAKALLGAASGPVLTIASGAIAWKKVGTEALQARADANQRKQEEDARKAQALANLKNRDAFNTRIEQLRAKINALKKDHDIVTQNLPKAKQQADIAEAASKAAEKNLNELRKTKERRDEIDDSICEIIKSNQPTTLKNDIDALRTQAEEKQRESDRLLNEARQLAATCASIGDAQAVRDRYASIKPLLGQIDSLKKQADQKKSELDKLRRTVEDFKGQYPAKVAIDVADQLLAADNAAKEATDLVTQIRDSIKTLEADQKRFRGEIYALQSAIPEALVAVLQDRINDLQGLLSSLTTYPPLVRYDDQASDSAKRTSNFRDEALRIQASWKGPSCQAEIPSVDTQGVETARTMTGLNIAAAADLLRQAQVCEASAKCIPVINQARQVIEQLRIEEGEAAINQARQQGCNVDGLLNTLDYYRTIRDAVALLYNAKQQCKFQEGVSFAQKMPSSIQNNPWVANALNEVRDGLAAQQRVEQLITKATEAGSLGSSLSFNQAYAEARKKFAEADGYLAEADPIAAPYSCVVDRLNRYKGEYNRLKVAVNKNSGGQGATGATANQTPTDEVPPGFGPGKPTNQPPTDEVPPGFGPGKPTNQPPTDEVPPGFGPAKPANQPPTDEVPPGFGPNKGQPPVSNNSGGQAQGNKESKPKDPNKPSKSDRIGALIGGIISTAAADQERRRREGGSGGSGGTKGGGNTGGGGGNSGGSSGSSGGSAGLDVDLSGTWTVNTRHWYTDKDGRRVSDTLSWRLVLQRTGGAQWSGTPFCISTNCAVVNGDPVTVQVTGPGQCRAWLTDYSSGQKRVIDGTCNSSRISVSDITGVRQ